MYTAVSGAWQPVAGSTVDTVAHTVSAPVTHFSVFAILADNQFAGSYNGTYTGTGIAGTWKATVGTDGNLAATASGGFVGATTVSFTGASTIPLAGSGTSQGNTVTFAGSFTLQSNGTDVSASGTWSSSNGQSGTWMGSKSGG